MQRQMFDLLEGWLRHKSDMVNLEAARAISEMKGVTAQQLTRSIAGMHRCLWLPIPCSITGCSATTLPLLTKINTEVRSNSDIGYTCCDPPAKRGRLQHGLGKPNL